MNPMIAITLSNSVSAFRSGGIASAGTYEVTVQTLDNGAYYDTSVGNPRLYLLISKTASERWLFGLDVSGSGAPDVDSSQYTNVASVPIDVSWSSAEVADAVYTVILNAGFNVTINNTELTITASQTGDLPDSVGFPSPTITPGT
jgi:hypothetical protein